MKKYYKYIMVIFLLIMCVASIIYYQKNYQYNNIVNVSKKDEIRFNSSISMMYETEVGSGEYVQSNDNLWPNDGYVFNETLSKCENGGTLTWDDANKKVLMSSITSDKCYVYFDIQLTITITEVTLSNFGDGWGINLDAVKTDSDETIANYYISVDNYPYKEISIGTYISSEDFGQGSAYCGGNVFIYSIFGITDKGIKTEVFNGTFDSACFVAGTKVWTPKGYANIEDINIGDEVYSYNEKNNKVEINRVYNTLIYNKKNIYEIYIRNQVIRTTSYHRFFVRKKYDIKGSWIQVQDLRQDDYLYNSYGVFEKINNIIIVEDQQDVYNFEVENDNNYFITSDNYLVHNAYWPCTSYN